MTEPTEHELDPLESCNRIKPDEKLIASLTDMAYDAAMAGDLNLGTKSF